MIRNLGSLISDELRHGFIQKMLQDIGSISCVLDIGCGSRPYAALYAPRAVQSFGFDVPFTDIGQGAFPDVFATAQHLPVRDGCVQLLMCTEVLEHVPDPMEALAEFWRVISPGGWVLLTTPFLVPEHDAPYDFFRYTRYGLQQLLLQQGFEIKSLEGKGDLIGVSVVSSVRYQLKFWRGLAKVTRLSGLGTMSNPLVALGVWGLQKLYLAYWKTSVHSSHSLPAKIHQVFAYGPLGFMVLAQKPV